MAIARVLFLTALCIAVVWPAADAAWTTSGGSNRLDSHSPDPLGPATYAWVFPRSPSDAVVADGRAYVAGSAVEVQGNSSPGGGLAVYALDLATGSIVWQRTLQAPDPTTRPGSYGTPTLEGGRVYYYDNLGRVWALEAATGAVAWSQSVGAYSFMGRSSPLVVGGLVVVPAINDPNGGGLQAGSQDMVALDAATGAQRWRVLSPFVVTRNLASDGTRFYGTAGGDTTVAWRLSDGGVQWVFAAPRGGMMSESVVRGGTVYVTNLNSYGQSDPNSLETQLYALDGASGTLLWGLGWSGGYPLGGTTPDPIPYAPAVDDSLIVVAGTGRVHAVDTGTHQVRWDAEMGGPSRGAPVLASDAVVVGRRNLWQGSSEPMRGGTLMAFRRDTGAAIPWMGSVDPATNEWTDRRDSVTVEWNQARFLASGQYVLGGFDHISNAQIPWGNALYALGPDKQAPTWADARSLTFQTDGNGAVYVHWGLARDLNMKGFTIEHQTAPQGPWSVLGTTSWDGLSSDSGDPGLNFPVHDPSLWQAFRVAPVDRSGNAGASSSPGVWEPGKPGAATTRATNGSTYTGTGGTSSTASAAPGVSHTIAPPTESATSAPTAGPPAYVPPVMTAFGVVPRSVSFDVSFAQPGVPVRVFAQVANPTGAPRVGTVSLAAFLGNGSAEYAARLPVSVPAHGVRLVETAWTPARIASYQVWAALDADASTAAADAARNAPNATSSLLSVGTPAAGQPLLALSGGLLNIGALDAGSTRTIPLQVTAYNALASGVRVELLDADGTEVQVVTPPTDVAAGQTVQFLLQVRVPALPSNVTAQDFRLLVRAVGGGAQSNVETLDLVAHPARILGAPGLGILATVAAGGLAAFFRRRL